MSAGDAALLESAAANVRVLQQAFSDMTEPPPPLEGQTWYRTDERKFYRIENGKKVEYDPGPEVRAEYARLTEEREKHAAFRNG